MFNKEAKRRAVEQIYLEQRRMEDEVIWVTNDAVGLAECAQCEKHYEKADNDDGACIWHTGKWKWQLKMTNRYSLPLFRSYETISGKEG